MTTDAGTTDYQEKWCFHFETPSSFSKNQGPAKVRTRYYAYRHVFGRPSLPPCLCNRSLFVRSFELAPELSVLRTVSTCHHTCRPRAARRERQGSTYPAAPCAVCKSPITVVRTTCLRGLFAPARDPALLPWTVVAVRRSSILSASTAPTLFGRRSWYNDHASR